MAVLDQEVLSEIQGALIEPEAAGASWASGLWTVNDVIEYMDERQRDFLKETFCLVTPATLTTIPNVLRHPLPQDWIATYDVQWHTPEGVFKELPRSDSFEAALWIIDLTFQTQPAPNPCTYADHHTLLIHVIPA